jgi:hypothetical protein
VADTRTTTYVDVVSFRTIYTYFSIRELLVRYYYVVCTPLFLYIVKTYILLRT